jgi:hypothetical protein
LSGLPLATGSSAAIITAGFRAGRMGSHGGTEARRYLEGVRRGGKERR